MYTQRNLNLWNSQHLTFFDINATNVAAISEKVDRRNIQKQIKLSQPYQSLTQLWLGRKMPISQLYASVCMLCETQLGCQVFWSTYWYLHNEFILGIFIAQNIKNRVAGWKKTTLHINLIEFSLPFTIFSHWINPFWISTAAHSTQMLATASILWKIASQNFYTSLESEQSQNDGEKKNLFWGNW